MRRYKSAVACDACQFVEHCEVRKVWLQQRQAAFEAVGRNTELEQQLRDRQAFVLQLSALISRTIGKTHMLTAALTDIRDACDREAAESNQQKQKETT